MITMRELLEAANLEVHHLGGGNRNVRAIARELRARGFKQKTIRENGVLKSVWLEPGEQDPLLPDHEIKALVDKGLEALQVA